MGLMRLFYYKYLNSDVIKGFDRYKYSSQDTSPFSNYVMHPFWGWLVQFLPRWLAPNLLTVTGFLCLVVNALLAVYFDPEMYASSAEYSQFPAIPAGFWLASAALGFMSHTLDGMDGKQARRTGTGSPVGELLDHGLDSWTTLLYPMIAHAVFGRGRFGVDPGRLYLIYLAVMGQFYLSHWEKYVTGVLFLPWGYDLSQVALVGLYLATYVLGTDFWQDFAIGDFTYPDIAVAVVYGGFWTLCVPLTIYNVAKAFRAGTNRKSGLVASVEPLAAALLLLASSAAWAYYSPNNVLHASPRLFFTAFGTVFTNIACRLIVSQMSQTRCELFNTLGCLYCLTVAGLLLRRSSLQFELACLGCLTVVAVVAHLHYWCCVVRQMLDHFGLRAFVIVDKGVKAK
ncbi:hypothetical protein BOX15_Mlig017260g1 [Macrostomum lignano]|uniref:Ethanolaminephosphotransferase n=2 Tax=Macrostomum lignano TaxID=282301 RepID=A0A1I8J6U7_9PLAT|nr:hypothetical protein BOX15_Mlig017260g1 [Macrostomum lignano]